MHHEPMHGCGWFARRRPIHPTPERVVRGVQCETTDDAVALAQDVQRPRREVTGDDGGVRISLVPLLDAVGPHPDDAGVFEDQ